MGYHGLSAFTDAILPLMEYCARAIPDKKEREALGNQVIADIQNPDYHLYCDTYILFDMSLI